eukprot:2952789-Rhodomonas_salina.1
MHAGNTSISGQVSRFANKSYLMMDGAFPSNPLFLSNPTAFTLQMEQRQLDATLAKPAGWDAFYSFSASKQGTSGYSGVATFCRQSGFIPSLPCAPLLNIRSIFAVISPPR